ncbi:SDR family NAD(P)-dependent oxidoreductase [Desulfobacterales bacterium HSG16]|nr:SDR family NAD(P)-dependent oxidoreductase [Desulfobacterales bacterium HSG16]
MSEIYSDDIIEESMVGEDMVDEDAVAIVGMAGRFPGADSVESFWENLCNGKESITFFSAKQLLKAGISPQILDNPAYVPARGVLSDIEMFDADFFGFYPREAEIMDVQHRIFLECAWQALENAGYDPDNYDGEIGVYAGAGMSTYFLNNLIPYFNVADPSFAYQAILSNDKDFLSTLTAYKLNLKGPAIGVQSACSTSLVAVHTACQSIANGECDMALAGGVSIDVPQVAGYMYEEGMILSKDGHCRAFDEKAGGTVPASACGIVLLKRLNDAVEDKDNILAVIKGSAVNNDGSLKAGYTAPGIDGQTDVIAQALAVADIEPETISCLEAHGTGTSLGDPVEIEALKKAFDTGHGKKGFCAIGSVKTNIGHTNAASGIAGFIKTVLSVKHNLLVPCLHFNKANPGIDFENSPFFVNTQLTDRKNSENIPMRAGVSSFGIGGTNAHIIIEGYHDRQGYPCQSRSVPDSEKKKEKPALLILSAKTENALDKAAENLARHFENYPDIDIHDAAYTLQIGRRSFAHRRTMVCHNTKEVIQNLTPGKKYLASSVVKSGKRPVIFMFSGQGTQYTGMAEDLYTNNRIFKEAVDCCAKKLLHLLDFDIRDVIWPKSPGIRRNLPDISSSDTCQPAIFVIEYALSQLFMKWGICPAAVTGHSLGEYAAACVSGIFNLDDALKLVCRRGKLINDLPPGAMIAVPMPEEDIKSYMEPSLCFAAVNTPKRCVISGPLDAINRIANRFEKDGVQPVRLKTSHAFHSSMIEPAIKPFADFFEGIDFGNIKIPMLSSVSGSWLKNEQVNNPEYWTNQMRSTVRFKEVIEKIFENNNGEDSPVLLEIGPGTTLAGIVRSHPATPCDHPVITSTRHPKIISDTDNKMADTVHITEAVGKLWAAGADIDWEGFYDGSRHYRVPLPSYPFERKRYWIEEKKSEAIKREPLLKKRNDDPALIWKYATETAAEKAGEQDMNSLKWQEKKADMNRLCLAYINRAFQESGAFIKENVELSTDDFFNKYSVLPQFHSLVSHWLTLLAEDGQIHISQVRSQDRSQKKSEDKYSNLAIIEQKVFDELLKKTEAAWADEPLWLERLKKCGKNLDAIITGKEDPLMLLFPEKGFDTAEKMIKESSLVRYYNPIMQAALKKIVEKLPQETGIRVLEIGAGMGVCTSWLLPILPADRTEYYYTDVGQLFLNQAEKKFSDYPFVKYRILDIEQSLLSSEIKAGFDIIVAANVLHVTEKIDRSLANARHMLAKNGIFFLWEITDAPYYFHITDGLLMNDVNDKNRSRANPFLDTKQWTAALTDHGFSKVAQFPENDAAGSHIFMAFADESSKNENTPPAFSQKICKSADKNLLQRRSEISEWFYLPSWKRSRLPALKSESKLYENILIFIDDKGLGRKIKSNLDKNGHDTIIITPGDSYKKEDSRAYTIAYDCQSDYAMLFDDLFSSDRLPDTCIHLWSITDSEKNNNEKPDEKLLDESLNKGFYSLAFIAREFRRKAKSAPLKLMVISNGVHDVTGEETLCPEKAPIIAPIMVIGREYPEISCRHIDIIMPKNINKQGIEEISDQILAEKVLLAMQQSVSDHVDPCIALRGKYRWTKAWEQAGCDMFEHHDVSVLKEKGVYLITGGLGDVGGNLAELLAEKKKARLVLTGRSVHIERDKWDQWQQTHGENDPISVKIAKIKKLEILGAEIMIEAADVANYEQMKKVVSKAKSAFGRIDGIIHAAGVTRANSFSLIDEINQKDCNKHFHSKIFGSLVLSQIVREESPDFCILVSSLSSVLGGTGLAAYAGANLFMDALAVNAGRMKECVIKSVNSDIWQFTGDRTGKTDIRSSLAQLAMTAEQGKQVFEKIFDQPDINHILVSTADLKQRMAYKPVSFKQKAKNTTEKKSLTHKRPDTGKPYIAPRNAIERQLVDIWQKLLGIEPVGIQDDFFDLGGDSLLGTQIISRVRNRFNIDLPVKSLFAEPTISGLSELMEQLRLEQADDEALASLIDQLEKMPDEEVKKLLDIENERVGKNETES